MELIEACLSIADATKGDLEKKLKFLQRIGIHDLIFSDFSGLRNFNQQMEGFELPIGRLNVISRPNTESIKMIWNIIRSLDSFTIFLQHNNFVGDDEFKDALYHAFCLTDNIGCAFEGEALITFPLDDMIQTLQDEFQVNCFLILDSEGLLIPNKISRCLKILRSKTLKGSQILYFPNDSNTLGLITALYAMRLKIDGLVGSAIKEKCNNPKFIDLIKLHLLYQQKKDGLYSKHLITLLDHVFESFVMDREE